MNPVRKIWQTITTPSPSTEKQKIIIGIHGLGNKPAKWLLKKWWKQSIYQGLKSAGYPRPFIKFKLVYWANHIYPKALNPLITDKKHALYLEDPYTRCKTSSAQIRFKKLKIKFLEKLENILDNIFFKKQSIVNLDLIADVLLKHFFRDLYLYYHQEEVTDKKTGLTVKQAIRKELEKILTKYQNKQILLIAHSMGSIIAYDVLTHTRPRIKVQVLMTIGSPLGLPVIMKKAFQELKQNYSKNKRLPVPDTVTRHWYNLSDLDDRVSINYNLADDYKTNSRQVRPVDLQVINSYRYKDIINPHKSYGYLQTPEAAKIIHEFLGEARDNIFAHIENKVNSIIKKISGIDPFTKKI